MTCSQHSRAATTASTMGLCEGQLRCTCEHGCCSTACVALCQTLACDYVPVQHTQCAPIPDTCLLASDSSLLNRSVCLDLHQPPGQPRPDLVILEYAGDLVVCWVTISPLHV
jgi:hypothetical protein